MAVKSVSHLASHFREINAILGTAEKKGFDLPEERTRATVIIPSLNPDDSLVSYVGGVVDAGYDVLVVDDGSSLDKRPMFDRLEHLDGVHVLRHFVNMGKGRALKDAFNYYLTHNAESCGVITADSDGQHTLEDINKVAAAMAAHDDALVLGARDFSGDNVPPKSAFGNKLTRRVLKMLWGGAITDTQTGLRGIPRSLIPEYLTLSGERFEYETGMLIEALSKKTPVIEVPIETIYIAGNSGTHFNPIVDSLKIYGLIFGSFLKFLLSSLSASLIDLAVFQAVVAFLGRFALSSRVGVATAVARLCSSLYNYKVNKSVVFKTQESEEPAGSRPIVRYYTLVVVQACLSAACVFALSSWLGMPELLSKIIVDSLLFLLSYQVQRRWVFAS